MAGLDWQQQCSEILWYANANALSSRDPVFRCKIVSTAIIFPSIPCSQGVLGGLLHTLGCPSHQRSRSQSGSAVLQSSGVQCFPSSAFCSFLFEVEVDELR